MKRLSLFLLAASTCLAAFAQDNCDGYFQFKEGSKVELTTYDKKDKPTSIVRNTIIKKTPANGGFLLVFKSETFDAKGKPLTSGEFNGRCENGSFYSDIRNFSSDAMPKGPEFEMTFVGDQLAYPNQPTAGQALSDAGVKITSGIKGGMTIMNMTIAYTNRKVEGMETVETPAGKFDCVKVSYDLAVKVMGTRQMKGVEYLAKGVGVVKSELYDDKGRKESSTLLTKME
ncbi:DUF3108 domain-containing protein [Rhodoflexus caldus]|uniref:DUF3108 domain-containing protein n=1 Tax=Rhodoflexus caldus TaxID=2891236 RepID=UPI002029E702|nr:DUF3108 domain-containing protein [Rhodoflexus caldus]